jgi:hypothetical protein
MVWTQSGPLSGPFTALTAPRSDDNRPGGLAAVARRSDRTGPEASAQASQAAAWSPLGGGPRSGFFVAAGGQRVDHPIARRRRLCAVGAARTSSPAMTPDGRRAVSNMLCDSRLTASLMDNPSLSTTTLLPLRVAVSHRKFQIPRKRTTIPATNDIVVGSMAKALLAAW